MPNYANEGHSRPVETDRIAEQVEDFWIWFDEREKIRESLPQSLGEPVDMTQILGDEDVVWE